jgi:hypothetical protein
MFQNIFWKVTGRRLAIEGEKEENAWKIDKQWRLRESARAYDLKLRSNFTTLKKKFETECQIL